MSELVPTQIATLCSVKTLVGSTCVPHVELPLFTCTLEDTTNLDIPADSTLVNVLSAPDIFGSKGFVGLYAVKSSQSTRPLWKQCDNVYYCDGPEFAGIPNDVWYDRYQHRWKFLYVDGYFFFGRTDQTLQPVDEAIFPTSYNCERFSVAFDKNARPVFVCQLGNVVEIRRLEAGSLTVVSFTGHSPVLFLNALLQRDNSLQDVVCYYLRDGNLYGRWQRQEFGTEYLLCEGLDVTELKTCRFTRDTDKPYEMLFALKNCATRMLKSDIYEAWPAHVISTLGCSFSLGNGEYAPVILTIADVLTEADASFQLNSDGLYFPVILVFPTTTTTTNATFSLSSNGVYTLVIVLFTTEQDTANVSFTLSSDGSYNEVIEPAGSYADTTNATFSLSSDGSYYVP